MTWLALQLALGVALLCVRLHGALGAAPLRRLRLSRAVFACAIAGPLLMSALPSRTWTLAPAQVWSAPDDTAQAPAGVLQVGGPRLAARLPTWPVGFGTRLGILLAALVVAALLRGALVLRSRLSRAVVVRRIGRVRIALCAEGKTPWTAVLGRGAWIVLDPETARSPRLRRLALLHELQHLRAGDARWAWALLASQAAFLWSPLAGWLRAAMVECEELACDAAIVGRGRVAARPYAAALLDVAERGLGVGPSPLPALQGHSLLHRRIDMLISLPRPVRPALDAVLIACCLALVCAGARGAEALLADHRVDEARAQSAARRASAGAEFPVVVNDVVLAQLNQLVATPDGRRFVQAALKRRPSELEAIRAALSAQQLPAQLDAVPLIETGYRNIDAHEHGAGLWQFIVPTAQKYGLRVSPGADDRMNPQLEALAAARYLAELRQQFGEWPLALAAYTQGENKVAAIVQREGTRDAWELIRRGKLDPYAAKVMAAVLIIADPALAQE